MEDEHSVLRCNDHESLVRVESLVNIEFSLFLVVMVMFIMAFYLAVIKRYDGEQVLYVASYQLMMHDACAGRDQEGPLFSLWI